MQKSRSTYDSAHASVLPSQSNTSALLPSQSSLDGNDDNANSTTHKIPSALGRSQSISSLESASSRDDGFPLLDPDFVNVYPSSKIFLPDGSSHDCTTWTSVQSLYRGFKRKFGPPGPSKSHGGRRIQVSVSKKQPLIDTRTGKPYIPNRIRSNKYTIWTFIPRQLVAQLSKLANFYFLCFAILQLIPGLSTIGNKTNIVPLSIFIGISMLKEAIDDYKRHRLDRVENEQKVFIIDRTVSPSSGELGWQKTRWSSLEVGDIVSLKRGEAVPADVIVLYTVNENAGIEVFIETIALDGETNLKRKLAIDSVAEACAAPEKLDSRKITFVVEDPNSDLHAFRGKVSANGTSTALSNANIVYRGSVIRNTRELVAIVVYTGDESKIRMNAQAAGHARIKAPRLQTMLNRVVVLVALLVIGLAVYNTIAYQFWKAEVESKQFYLRSAYVPLYQEVFGFIIMFATMVPLSLYVSMEMIKLAQIYFLNSDIHMYDQVSNIPFEARTSTINEELGQITHILSDKTGTLTANEMKFRRLHLDGIDWNYDLGDLGNDDPTKTTSRLDSKHDVELSKVETRKSMKMSDLVNQLAHYPDSVRAQKIKMMLLCMTLCHSCVPEKDPAGMILGFQASSPDELAIIEAARDLGYLVSDRRPTSITLEMNNLNTQDSRTEVFEILDTIEFSNDRKRMSVVVRFPDRRKFIICKGADSVIVERLRNDEVSSFETTYANITSGTSVKHSVNVGDNNSIQPHAGADFEYLSTNTVQCVRSVNSSAREGLRTLLYAYRPVTTQEYETWKPIWNAANTSLAESDLLIKDAAQLIEKDLQLIGATAIEDKLQKGVTETITKFLRANIKIFMLTGDKEETAIDVGRSCGLVQRHAALVRLADHDGAEALARSIDQSMSTISEATHSVVIINGNVLAIVDNEASSGLEDALFRLLRLADSVICCRAQPSQKAQLVRSLRKHVPDSITLAVGDGANDIAMIEEAHVGVGIMGKEGSQAARSSDYSIGQFRFLQRLILVHGRWNYIRTCKYILGTLWKEIVFFLPQALFQRWNGFTGTSLYEPWTLGMYNTLFTSLPVMIIGIFEQDVPASTLLALPELYRSVGQRDQGFNIAVYLFWTAMGVIEALIVYFCMFFCFARSETRKDDSVFPMGDLDFVAVVIIISMKLQFLEMHNRTIIAFGSLILSIGAAFLWNIILAIVYPATSIYKVRNGFFFGFGRDSTWWATLVFIVSAVLLFELMVSTCKNAFGSSDAETMQVRKWQETRVAGAYRDDPGLPGGATDIELQSVGRNPLLSQLND